jgi:hypothetical protein
LKVLFISGWGRSGSTLLDNMLGQLDQFVSVGELRYVWDRGLQQNRRCGCGAAFRDCTFWQDVFRDAFGGFDRVEAGEMLNVRDRYDHARMLLLHRSMRSSQIERYQSNLVKLYRSITAVSGARVVVDSSKTPSHGRILQGCPELDVHVVHLIRDSRAVAYSWQRKKLARDVDGLYMTQFSSAHSSFLWDGMNAAAEMLKTANPARYLCVRYEDLVTAPRTTLSAILSLVGEGGAQMPFLQDSKVVLSPVHGFSGNPSRFERGVVELRPDDEWRSKLKSTQRLLVTALTGPLLVRYGYPLFSFNWRRNHMPSSNEAADAFQTSPDSRANAGDNKSGHSRGRSGTNAAGKIGTVPRVPVA